MSGTHITPVVGAISFWLTVVLAAVGSVLSALCVYDPVSEPKRDPYSFMGQWFIWLVTPLLWGTVAASSSMEWLQPLDLLLILVLVVACRWAAQAVCNLKWRGKTSRRVGSAVYFARPQQDS